MKKKNFRMSQIRLLWIQLWKQLVALILFFALSFGVAALSLGYFALPGDTAGTEFTFAPFFPVHPDETVFTENSSTTPSTNTDDPNQDPSQETYLTNLRSAFNTGLIEGYVNDRILLSLSQRILAYEKLAGDIEQRADAVPEVYQSYNADEYELVRGIRLEGDFTDGSEVIVQYSKIYSSVDGSYQTVATNYTLPRKKVQPYMGYLIISHVETRTVTVTAPPASTESVLTDQPATDEPSTSLPPATESPVTNPPITDQTNATPPATEPPSTNPPVTASPVTDPPITEPSDTNPSDTESPSTESPSTELPSTELPVTEVPSTEPSVSSDSTDVNMPATPSDPFNCSSASAALTPKIPASVDTPANSDSDEPQTVTVEVTVLTLCDRLGNVLVADLNGKQPYYARDNRNLPVFIDENEQLYAFDGQKFTEINQSDLRIWLSYDYPAYPLGTYRNYEAVYDETTGAYSYINYKTGKTAITTTYFKAFNYASNGYAVVVSVQNNTLLIVNTSKRIMFNSGGRYQYPTGVPGHGLSAQNVFRLPDTLGIESIGSAGYDHGWLRIRIQALSQMSNTLNTVINDWETLVDEKGNYFELPEGYTLEGYSDGVLLLSKDGLYGYYGIDGSWITQPIFPYARPFIQGLAVVGSADGTVGMIDTDGNIVLPFVYTSLSDCSSGVITAYCEGIGWETYYLTAK